MKKYYYLYETTNLTNGKKYIGQHCTKDLNDGYYGSCKELKEDVKKGHKVNVRIIKFFDNVIDLGNAEYDVLQKRKVRYNDLYYNINDTLYYNRYFDKTRPDHAKKMNGTRTFGDSSGNKNGFYGKSFSKESLLKISNSQKKRLKNKPIWNKGLKQRWINKENKQKMILEKDLQYYIKSGWNIGRGFINKN